MHVYISFVRGNDGNYLSFKQFLYIRLSSVCIRERKWVLSSRYDDRSGVITRDNDIDTKHVGVTVAITDQS